MSSLPCCSVSLSPSSLSLSLSLCVSLQVSRPRTTVDFFFCPGVRCQRLSKLLLFKLCFLCSIPICCIIYACIFYIKSGVVVFVFSLSLSLLSLSRLFLLLVLYPADSQQEGKPGPAQGFFLLKGSFSLQNQNQQLFKTRKKSRKNNLRGGKKKCPSCPPPPPPPPAI